MLIMDKVMLPEVTGATVSEELFCVPGVMVDPLLVGEGAVEPKLPLPGGLVLVAAVGVVAAVVFVLFSVGVTVESGTGLDTGTVEVDRVRGVGAVVCDGDFVGSADDPSA